MVTNWESNKLQKEKLISCIKIYWNSKYSYRFDFAYTRKFDQNPTFNWVKIISVLENIEIVKFFFKELYYK